MLIFAEGAGIDKPHSFVGLGVQSIQLKKQSKND